MYLAGYAVECLLKAKLMRMFGHLRLSDLEKELLDKRLLAAKSTVFTHQLEELLRLARGWDRLRSNPRRWASFTIANRWIPAWRYSPDLASRDDAEAFLEAVDETVRRVENNT
jgi:HEPN domain-containing protein